MLTRSRFAALKTSPLDYDPALICWCPFDNGTALDYSGNQNNGVATGTPVFAGSEMGNSYGFTSGNYFSVTTLGNANPIATNRVTVAAWLKPNVTTRGDILSVWAGDGGGGASDQFVLLYGLTSGKPQMFLLQNGGANVNHSGVGSTAMATGLWYHVAGLYDGVECAVYLNGKLEASQPNVNQPLGTGASNPIQIGGSAGGTNPLNGSLADVRFYNRGLSGVEINALYNQGLARFALSPDEWEMPALFAASAAVATGSAFSTPQLDGRTVTQMIGY